MSINKVILVGHVGGDPQIRTVGDRKVASFNLATTEKYKDRSGQMVENTEWHSVSVWEKLAEVVESYVKKGTLIYVEGKIKTEKYTDKDGNDRYATRIQAATLQLLGGKPEGNSTNASAPQNQSQSKFKTTPIVAGEDQGDDLPF